MITAIDSNILIDIFGADPEFGHKSSETLRKCMREGAVHANEIVWTEVGAIFPNLTLFTKNIRALEIEFSAISQESCLIAAQAWQEYRKNGGKRQRVAADFLIGAHAKNQCDRLLTRDRGFYRSYFKTLEIVDPSKS